MEVACLLPLASAETNLSSHHPTASCNPGGGNSVVDDADQRNASDQLLEQNNRLQQMRH